MRINDEGLSSLMLGTKIMARVGEVAYRLELPDELSGIHSTFHVSHLRKCLADESAHVPLTDIEVDNSLNFIKEPVAILNRKEKCLRNKIIRLVKIGSGVVGPLFWTTQIRLSRAVSLWHVNGYDVVQLVKVGMMSTSLSPSSDEEHVVLVISTLPVATLGESPKQHPLPSEGSKTEPSEESLTPPPSVVYGGISRVHVMDGTQH
ncbi:hypothetical protein L1987_78279 [Smallanthus sonchifolius]|uniref:Uncharacterized protein n=1 Tax=Smallanthus sonchifolius TaxID=185202 RepID=A0ACB8ZC87_9ASTR|nr:hypothetical protein L1987_78279 [Smallanthus sonchifolius]